VNEQISEAFAVTVHQNVPLAEAERRGAMMMFGEKYGAHVRMVEIPGRSIELCGGTHVPNTREISFFRLVSEGGVAAGVRRIEAATNARAFELANSDRALLGQLSALLKAPESAVADKLSRLLEDHKALEKRLDQLQRQQAKATADEIVAGASQVGEARVVSVSLGSLSRDALLALCDFVRDRLGPGVGVGLLGAIVDEKPTLAVLVTDAGVARGLKAGALVNASASHIDGKGGGRPTLAQAGGRNADGLPAAIQGFAEVVRSALG
jgi:alanyl-tRNA synthetase